MNKNVLIVLGGAVAVAVVVAMLVQVTLGGKEEAAPTVQEAKIELLVASKDLAIGRELKSGDLRWQEWPKNSVFPGAITREDDQSAEEAVEGRLARNIAEGEPMMKSALLGQSKGNFVAASLEPGMRAIAVGVSADSMVGGFVGPGDYVDVVLTYRKTVTSEDDDPRVQNLIQQNLDRYATETILQNVKVLAVDQTAQRPQDEETIKVGKTVTLAVNAQDAERLSLAAGLGDLVLILRGVGDDVIVEKTWPTVSDARLVTVDDEIFKEYENLKNTSGINGNIVRIYSGDQLLVAPSK